MGEDNITGKLKRKEENSRSFVLLCLLLWFSPSLQPGLTAVGRGAWRTYMTRCACLSKFIEGFPVFVICNMGL